MCNLPKLSVRKMCKTRVWGRCCRRSWRREMWVKNDSLFCGKGNAALWEMLDARWVGWVAVRGESARAIKLCEVGQAVVWWSV